MSESKSLVQLLSDAAQVEAVLLEHGGDMDAPEVQAALAVIEVHLPAKIDAYAYRVSRLRATAAMLKEKREELARLEKSFNAAADRTEENMIRAIEQNGAPFEGFEFEARIKFNPESVEILEESKLPEACFKIERKVSLSQTKALLQSGAEIVGARLKRDKKLVFKPIARKLVSA